VLVQGKATSVRGSDGAFEVEVSNGSFVSAKTVVLALGVPGAPAVPPAFKHLPERIAFHTEDCERICKLQKGCRVLVIVGGLTSVQAAQLAIRRHCKVTLCSRRQLVTRNFDIPIEWFDPRKQGRLRHDFWLLPAEERLTHLRATKGGGSVPNWYMEQLKASQAAGDIEVICGEAEVCSVNGASVEVKLAGRCQHFDQVIFACGHKPDITALPLTRELQAQWPIPTVVGLPVLSKDLQWGTHEQLFVVGALSGLQIGPDAANLMGCRRAAEVVAQSLGLRLWQRFSKPSDGSISICGNRYAALGYSEDDDDDDTTDVETVDSGLDTDSTS